MVEVRRYVARDARGAEGQLESDRSELACRGLRPTWRVWLEPEASGRRDGFGELIVCFDPPPGPEPERPSPIGLDPSARAAMLALIVDMRELLRLYRTILDELDGEPRRSATSPARPSVGLGRLRRVHALLGKIESRLEDLQRLGR
jgi:hypothetical protein